MKIEDVKSYKQIYKDIRVPFSVVEEKWLKQRYWLGDQYLPRPTYYRYMPYAYAVAGVVLFLTISILVSQAAKPGTSLYGVKALTKEVYSTLSKPFSSENNPSSLKSSAGVTILPTVIPTRDSNMPTPSSHPTSQEEKHESASATEHEHESDVKGVSVSRTPQDTFGSTHNDSENHDSQSGKSSKNQDSGSQNSHDNSDNNHSGSHGDH